MAIDNGGQYGPGVPRGRIEFTDPTVPPKAESEVIQVLREQLAAAVDLLTVAVECHPVAHQSNNLLYRRLQGVTARYTEHETITRNDLQNLIDMRAFLADPDLSVQRYQKAMKRKRLHQLLAISPRLS